MSHHEDEFGSKDDLRDWESPDDRDVKQGERTDSVDLAECPYCHKAVNEQAEICPHCHSFICFEETKRYSWWIWVGVVAVAVAILTWIVWRLPHPL